MNRAARALQGLLYGLGVCSAAACSWYLSIGDTITGMQCLIYGAVCIAGGWVTTRL